MQIAAAKRSRRAAGGVHLQPAAESWREGNQGLPFM
jgi:hypothetical protein